MKLKRNINTENKKMSLKYRIVTENINVLPQIYVMNISVMNVKKKLKVKKCSKKLNILYALEHITNNQVFTLSRYFYNAPPFDANLFFNANLIFSAFVFQLHSFDTLHVLQAQLIY